jgi:hypothetical protein
MAVIVQSDTRRRIPMSAVSVPRHRFMPLAAALLLMTLLPILVVRVPAMADYPNHLARMFAIASLDHNPLLARYYDVDWRLVPDLVMDAMVPALAQVMSIFAAGKLFVILTVVLLATGTLALHHALYRRWSLWPLTCLLFVYDINVFYGLLNYLFATALALWGAAAWIALRDASPWRRGAVSWLFVVAMFFSHFLGVGIYGMAIGSYELLRWYRRRSRPHEVAKDLATLLLPFLLVVPLMLASPTVDFAQATHWRLFPKLQGLYFIFTTYSPVVAIALALVVVGVVAWAAVTRRLRLHPMGMIFAPLAAVVYLAMPYQLMSAANVDVRLPATFVLFLIAMSDWRQRSDREAARFAVALSALIAIVVLTVGVSWKRHMAEVSRIEQSFAKVAPGSRVLVAVNQDGTSRTGRALALHLPALVLIERSAFYSHAFTHPAKQPLQVKPAFRGDAPYDGEKLLVDQLAAADAVSKGAAPAAPADPATVEYWADWRQAYDYLYVLFTPQGYRPPLDHLEPLDRTDTFALFKIDHLQ